MLCWTIIPCVSFPVHQEGKGQIAAIIERESAMCDEPNHKSLLETVRDQICEFLPEKLRNDEKFVHGFGQLCGFAAGWIIGTKVIELLFPRGDKK